ncbi:MAG TPA: nuclear transport factor 2 family protein [Actinocatenispora sp.]
MALSETDRTAVTELIARHGHLVDSGRIDRLDEVFTTDTTYDVTDLGGGVLHGTAAIREATLALGDGHPVGHLVTNTVLTETPDGIRALSKGLGVLADGTCGTVTYDDTVVRGEHGWRITHRTVLAHRRPLGAR